MLLLLGTHREREKLISTAIYRRSVVITFQRVKDEEETCWLRLLLSDEIIPTILFLFLFFSKKKVHFYPLRAHFIRDESWMERREREPIIFFPRQSAAATNKITQQKCVVQSFFFFSFFFVSSFYFVAEQPIKVPNHCPVFFHWACPASSRLYYLIRRFSIHFSCPNFYELIPRKRKKIVCGISRHYQRGFLGF